MADSADDIDNILTFNDEYIHASEAQRQLPGWYAKASVCVPEACSRYSRLRRCCSRGSSVLLLIFLASFPAKNVTFHCCLLACADFSAGMRISRWRMRVPGGVTRLAAEATGVYHVRWCPYVPPRLQASPPSRLRVQSCFVHVHETRPALHRYMVTRTARARY